MDSLAWIIASGLGMMAIALAGVGLLVLSRRRLDRWVIPLVALAAGTLIGTALFHLLPHGVARLPGRAAWVWAAVGFSVFFAMEMLLRWHHGQMGEPRTRPVNYLLLLGDGLHNLMGGLAVAGAFVNDIKLGIATWLAAAAHELPQELGDFGVLLHGGWSPRRALFWNVLSASAFLFGGLIAYALSRFTDAAFLLPLAAGSFLYIGASDLIPEIWHGHGVRRGLLHVGLFLFGLVLMYFAADIVAPATAHGGYH